MRIAQVAPLHECVPPKLYGGTERIVSWLTEELVRQGHDVTLFASGDSRTAAELVPCCDLALQKPTMSYSRPRLAAHKHALSCKERLDHGSVTKLSGVERWEK
jgi:hypothetical protein